MNETPSINIYGNADIGNTLFETNTNYTEYQNISATTPKNTRRGGSPCPPDSAETVESSFPHTVTRAKLDEIYHKRDDEIYHYVRPEDSAEIAPQFVDDSEKGLVKSVGRTFNCSLRLADDDDLKKELNRIIDNTLAKFTDDGDEYFNAGHHCAAYLDLF